MIKIVLFLLTSIFLGDTDLEKSVMLDVVNSVRVKGCKCGGKNMPPVGRLKWNEKLERSANAHATDMAKYRYFSHYSRKGEDVGKRVDRFEYRWIVVGENIAEGQRSFSEVMEDWLKSPSHCKMIMDPKVDEMGIAKSGRYWVQHFGKQKK